MRWAAHSLPVCFAAGLLLGCPAAPGVDDDDSADESVQGENLLVNPGGETGDFEGWDLYTIGVGVEIMEAIEAPDRAHSGDYLFVTSFRDALRYQTIDLVDRGFTEEYLDTEPRIHVGEWIRENCEPGDRWELTIELLDEDDAVLFDETVLGITDGDSDDDCWEDDEWTLVELLLEGYGPGVRKVNFVDGGRDGETWAGFYGPGFDDAFVVVEEPEE